MGVGVVLDTSFLITLADPGRTIPRAAEADTNPKRKRGTQHISSFTLWVSVPQRQMSHFGPCEV